MRKALPYIIGALIIGLLFIVFKNRRSNNQKTFDPRITLKKGDQNPYGCYVAFNSLPNIFPNAQLKTNKDAPGEWSDIRSFEEQQALIIVSQRFNADEYEVEKLINFAKSGNTVFISTTDLSYNAEKIFECHAKPEDEVQSSFYMNNTQDSFTVTLKNPPYDAQLNYTCPGQRYETYFAEYNASISNSLGEGAFLNSNFLEFKTGKGQIFIHLTPITFSNYFILHKKNVAYFNRVMSVIPSDVKKIWWDEYFLLNKKSSNKDSDSPGFLSGMLKNKSFAAAFWLIIVLLIIYTLLEMRRKQRPVPELPKPRNDSLEFVKTIGRLYHEKNDHLNLSRKMTAYFLEYVRSRYKISTATLDNNFINVVKLKSGAEESLIREIVGHIQMVDEGGTVSDKELSWYHKKLEEFYKTA